MRTINKIKDLQASLNPHRQSGGRIAFVPTMGNLHEGHISLVRRAKEVADIVVVSIFVNPLQFGANEDLDNYPRTLEADQAKLVEAGTNYLFTPEVGEMYPNGLELQTTVSVPEITKRHCGASREGHFDGVSTVVSKLFNMVRPDLAIFGEKDFQQLAVIRKMVADLCIAIDVVGVPTARNEDGLALSSRNGYLTEQEREIAPTLYKAILETKAQIEQGERDYRALEAQANAILAEKGFKPDYYQICDAHTLEPASSKDCELVILAAAYLGKTRLIDNTTLKLKV